MRLHGRQKRRSLGWWSVFLCACLAMGVYIAFDILDLDGSELRNPLPGDTLAAEPARGETERLLPQAPPTPEPLGLLPPSLTLRAVTEHPQNSSRAVPAPSAPRLDRIRPRSHLQQAVSSTRSSTSDPA